MLSIYLLLFNHDIYYLFIMDIIVDKKKKTKPKDLKVKKIITQKWERKWCSLCKHPNPKTLLFCQLCDSNLDASVGQ